MQKLGRKLSVKRETLRVLTDNEMNAIAGGSNTGDPCILTCDPSCPRTACPPVSLLCTVLSCWVCPTTNRC